MLPGREPGLTRVLQFNKSTAAGVLKEHKDLFASLRKSDLFAGMSEQDLEGCLTCSSSTLREYDKGETIFYMDDVPKNIMILVRGSVIVGRDTPDGRRIVMQTFDHPGDLFGEVYLFVDTDSYDHYAEALKKTQILEIPKEFVYRTCGDNCSYHSQLISNTMEILAKKAYFLDRRLLIMSSTSLREKIAKVLIMTDERHPGQPLSMTREQLAQYISTTRPSVSRELMNMQNDGLVRVEKDGIHIADRQGLEELTQT